MIHPLIAAALSMPMTHEVVTAYQCGKVRAIKARSLAAAKTHAAGECRKIGRRLIDRETGNVVQIVSVTIKPI